MGILWPAWREPSRPQPGFSPGVLPAVSNMAALRIYSFNEVIPMSTSAPFCIYSLSCCPASSLLLKMLLAVRTPMVELPSGFFIFSLIVGIPG